MEISQALEQVVFASSSPRFVLIHIYSGFRHAVEDQVEVGASQSLNQFSDLDNIGLESLLETLKRFLPESPLTGIVNTEYRTTISIIKQHAEADISDEDRSHIKYGFFERLIVNRENPTEKSGKILSIQIKLEGQLNPIPLLPKSSIKIFRPAESYFSGFGQDVGFGGEQSRDILSYERGRRRSQNLMDMMRKSADSSSHIAKEPVLSKYRYFDSPSAHFPAGTIHTEDENEARELERQRTERLKRNFFVRNHRELSASVLLCAIIIVLGVSLQFGFFAKNGDQPSTIVPSPSATISSSPACNGANSANNRVPFAIQLRGISATDFTSQMLASISAALSKVLAIDSDLTVCLDSGDDALRFRTDR